MDFKGKKGGVESIRRCDTLAGGRAKEVPREISVSGLNIWLGVGPFAEMGKLQQVEMRRCLGLYWTRSV